MALLKKISGSTLVETLVASAIILVVFVFGSLSLNNIFLSSVKNNDSQFQNRLRELEYFSSHDKVDFPFYEQNEQWDIGIDSSDEILRFNAINKRNNDTISYVIFKK